MNLATVQPWLPSLDELRLFTPELVLTATLVAVLLVPLVAGRRSPVAALVALVGTLLGLFATLRTAGYVAAGPQAGLAPPGQPPMLLVDHFSVFFKLFLFGLLALIVWLWAAGTRARQTAVGDGLLLGRVGSPEFFLLLLTSALGMMLMVGSLNLLVIVVAMETASLPSYAIVASDRRSRLGAEAAMKYVVFGAASAAIMVYGVSLLYGRFGTLDLGRIAAYASVGSAGASPSPVDWVFWLGLATVGVGVLFKIAAVPAHLWCPDVFEGAPIEITTWLSIASKAAGLGLLLRIVTALGGGGVQPVTIAWAVGALAAVTCTVGNLAALRQESVKRILAYSSIAHAGYMMMAGAILVPGRGGQTIGPSAHAGFAAVIAYLLVYILMNVGAFGAAAVVAWHTGTDRLAAFTGLGRRAPWIAVPLAVCLFSLVGLPPLGGFAAKWFLLVALGKSAAEQPWLWVLVSIAVINTAISLYYYVRIIRQMFLTDDESLPKLPAPWSGVLLANACAVVLLLLGTLWFSPLGRQAAAWAQHCWAAGSATRVALGS
jgi:NADH-quinone oxidoreductase subunit N